MEQVTIVITESAYSDLEEIENYIYEVEKEVIQKLSKIDFVK